MPRRFCASGAARSAVFSTPTDSKAPECKKDDVRASPATQATIRRDTAADGSDASENTSTQIKPTSKPVRSIFAQPYGRCEITTLRHAAVTAESPAALLRPPAPGAGNLTPRRPSGSTAPDAGTCCDAAVTAESPAALLRSPAPGAGNLTPRRRLRFTRAWRGYVRDSAVTAESPRRTPASTRTRRGTSARAWRG
jgi:hypothetical protein